MNVKDSPAGALRPGSGGEPVIVGTCAKTVFGMSAAERMTRQAGSVSGIVVASADAVLGDQALEWLQLNPKVLLVSDQGRPLAAVVSPADAAGAAEAIRTGGGAFEAVRVAEIPLRFSRKLRRRDKPFAASLEEAPALAVERALFGSVYKGVTDLVTKWLWPYPAFWVTRALAGAKVTPNQVTSVGLLLTFVTAYLFYRGEIGFGLASAWLMTFLDTVDGKLARVTVTSSKAGDLLDHGNDYLHPPLWWICLAAGLAAAAPERSTIIWQSMWVILATYVAGRGLEEGFKKLFGFNAYLWRPFDSAFRLIVSRRNPILLIMTIGLLAGDPVAAYIGCAAWSVASTIIQAVRFVQAWLNRPVHAWLT